MIFKVEVVGETASVRRGTSISSSLKRDEIAHIRWFTGGENFISKRDQFILYAFVNF